jgi:SAM-dependent methyltransferase
MSRLLGHLSLVSAFQRFVRLVRGLGVLPTLVMLLAVLDDRCLRSFDRKYRVRTSGLIPLANTSFERARLADATQYGPVNAWAFRRFLRQLNLPHESHFVDLGCGLGRACILAGEYGFRKVTGVELAPELCQVARANLSRCRLPSDRLSPVTILQMDAFDFCENTDADVFFMYRPFSGEFLSHILEKLKERAASQNRILTIIYSERMLVPISSAKIFAGNPAFRKTHEAGFLGQAFYVYQCGSPSAGPAAGLPTAPTAPTAA